MSMEILWNITRSNDQLYEAVDFIDIVPLIDLLSMHVLFKTTERVILGTVDYGLVKTHYLVKFLKIILDLYVPIIVSAQKKILCIK